MNIGDKLKINGRLIRRSERRPINDYGFTQAWKVWKPKETKEIEVYFLGFRTLSNGKLYYDSDAGYMYGAEEYIKGIMVTKGVYSAPFFVTESQITDKP
jgi:hypothetical protein